LTALSIAMCWFYRQGRFLLTTAARAGSTVYLVQVAHVSYLSMYILTIVCTSATTLMLEKITCQQRLHQPAETALASSSA
jgi:hypothetical protein